MEKKKNKEKLDARYKVITQNSYSEILFSFARSRVQIWLSAFQQLRHSGKLGYNIPSVLRKKQKPQIKQLNYRISTVPNLRSEGNIFLGSLERVS